MNRMDIETINDKHKSYYDRYWTDIAKRPFKHQHLKNRIFAIRKIMEKLELSRPSILELGCGLGYISNELSDFGDVSALDQSSASINIAMQKYPRVNFMQGDILKYEPGDQLFDIVVSSEVIEHIPEEKRNLFMQVIWESVRPNGWVILTTPNKAISDRLSNEQPIENHFSETELRDLVGSRFRIELLTSVQTLFPILSHRYRIFQAIRIVAYEVMRLRSFLEDPFKERTNGLYFVVLAQRAEQDQYKYTPVDNSKSE